MRTITRDEIDPGIRDSATFQAIEAAAVTGRAVSYTRSGQSVVIHVGGIQAGIGDYSMRVGSNGRFAGYWSATQGVDGRDCTSVQWFGEAIAFIITGRSFHTAKRRSDVMIEAGMPAEPKSIAEIRKVIAAKAAS